MMQTDVDHCQIVADSISGRRTTDEQTFASLTILTERLERLKQMGGPLADIDLSPDVRKLARKNRHAVAC
jgi:hypothetical protein